MTTTHDYPDGVPLPLDQIDEIPSPKELGYKVIDPYIDITGFEYVRGDSSEITGKMQMALFESILMQNIDKEEAIRRVEDSQGGLINQETKDLIVDALMKDEVEQGDVIDIVDSYYTDVKNGEYPVISVCPGPSIKEWDSYKQPPIAARAGRFTDQFFDDVNIQAGDNVYYVYVRSTGYNHSTRKLPEDSNVVGMIEEMEPPRAKVVCDNCNHKWVVDEFGKRIQREHSCPECGYDREQSHPDDPFDIDGCFANWEKIANKAIKDKAKKVLKQLGWENSIDSVGDQDTFASFM